MRNRLIHGYFDIDRNILWLPPLRESLRRLVAGNTSKSGGR